MSNPASGPSMGGRGAMLARIWAEQKARDAAGAMPDAPAGPPRGRAALMFSLLAKRQANGCNDGMPSYCSSLGSSPSPPSSVSPSPPCTASPSPPQASSPGLAVQPPTEQLGRMSVERAPISMHGESGKIIRATANYVALNMEPDRGVFEYEVRYDPEQDSKNHRIKYLNSNLHLLNVERGAKTFDGTTLYLPFLLPQQVTLMTVSTFEDEPLEIRIIFKRKKSLADCIHLYNVLFKRLLSILQFAQLGRQYFNPHAPISIPQHKMEIWPGYVTAVDEYAGGIMLCCDSSHRVLRTQTVMDVCREMAQIDKGNYKTNFAKEVIGQSVLTRYNNHLYLVEDVAWKKTPLDTFPVERRGVKTEMSYKEYYKKQYNITIKVDDQPLLISNVKNYLPNSREKVKQLICLVPELCYMTGLTDKMRADFKVMKDVAEHTRITPNQRQAAFKKFIANVRGNPEANALLASWGLTMNDDTVDVGARVVDSEKIIFKKGSEPGGHQADWNNALTRHTMMNTVDLTRWLLVFTSRDRRYADDFVKCMSSVAPAMGIGCTPPKQVQVEDRNDAFLRGIKENAGPGVQCVVIICPTARDDRYAAIKKLCCSDHPIPSQVINARTLSRPDKQRSIVMKIALQINCKLGGTLWEVVVPFNDIMVVGIDVFHDAVRRGSSVAGFVCSMNKSLTRWYSRVCIQGPQQELIESLRIVFIAAIKRFHTTNHRYPERIIIYRDGVGDGQLQQTQEFEVKQFLSCFDNIHPGYAPRLTVIVCQKRINTRIFKSVGNSACHDKLENPPPGTVVDNTVNRRTWYNFYLVSQHVRQGTVTPTHYVVIHDDCQMKVDHVQRLTYKLCHLYYNWPGTIRVPAPVQYAHKLAQLIGQSVNREPSMSLADKLYFL